MIPTLTGSFIHLTVYRGTHLQFVREYRQKDQTILLLLLSYASTSSMTDFMPTLYALTNIQVGRGKDVSERCHEQPQSSERPRANEANQQPCRYGGGLSGNVPHARDECPDDNHGRHHRNDATRQCSQPTPPLRTV